MRGTHDLAGVDLNLLVALDVLLEVGHVTQAAERLGVTQSALSHTLRRLRALFGDPLLVRVGSGMAPTPRAEVLRGPVRSALVAVGGALAAAADFVPATARRTFRLLSPDLFDMLILPHLLAGISGEAPGVDVVVMPGVGGEPLLPLLAQGAVDVAVVPVASWLDRPEGAELVQRVLLNDAHGCFVRRDHPALQGGGLSLEAYLAAAHLLVSPTGEGPGLVDGLLAAQGRQRRVALRVPGFAVAPRVVAQTELILTAPVSFQAVLGGLPVEMHPPPLPIAPHTLVLLWHRRFAADAGHRWFRERLIATVPQRTGAAVRPLSVEQRGSP